MSSLPRPLRLQRLRNFWEGFWQDDEDERIGSTDPERIKQRILDLVEPNGFKIRVWLVASSGFFADAYSLFSTNVILPALAYIYWPDQNNDVYGLAINEVTLAGSVIGMVLFGNLADRYGRKRLYGLELVIVIIATIGITQASGGYNQQSMSIFPWILFWRFILGIGIGAEYPLSALIASEWSSTQARGKTLAAVFLMQPLGQLTAYTIGYLALVGIASDRDLDWNETRPEVARPVIDSVWRCVTGVGGVTALIAIAARLSIPETPRWTLETDPLLALRDTKRVYLEPGSSETAVPEGNRGDQEPQLRPAHNNPHGPSSPEQIMLPEPAYPIDRDHIGDVGVSSATGNAAGAPDGQMVRPRATGAARGDNGSEIIRSQDGGSTRRGTHTDSDSQTESFKRIIRPPFTFKQWWRALGENESRKIFLALCLCWACLDVAFYGIGLDNPRVLGELWSPSPAAADAASPNFAVNNTVTGPAPSGEAIMPVLAWDARRALYTISISSVVGSLVVLSRIDYILRVTTLVSTFITLAVLFLIAGLTLLDPAVYENHNHSLTVVFYALIQWVFNFGPNTFIFMLPAEMFPTRYRGTCYGITAASGKLGAVVVQAIAWKVGVTDPAGGRWPLIGVLLAFSALMLVGALSAWAWIPEVQRPLDRSARRLIPSRKRWRLETVSLEDIEMDPTPDGQRLLTWTFGGWRYLRGHLGRRKSRADRSSV